MKTTDCIDAGQDLSQSPSQQTYPLSFGQEALWFESLLNPQSPASNIGGSFELQGELDVAALEMAITQVMARHDTLRTTICVEHGLVVQKVSPEPRFNLPLIDLSGADADTQAQALAHLSSTAQATVFSLEEGPLAKFSLTRLGEKRHVIHVAIHHIVADATSIAILKREVLLHYNAHKKGESVTLPPIPIQYGEYARWQRDCFKGEASEHHLAYWRKTLSGIPAILNLKSDFPRGRTISDAGATMHCCIDPGLTRALKAYCKSRRITLFAALLTGFASLLHQLSDEQDIVVGTAVTSRHRKEFQDLIGYFINLLPLRLRVNNSDSGDQLAKQASAVALEALAHQVVPFEIIVQQQRRGRVNGAHPVFQTAFVLNPPSKASYAISDLKVVDRPMPVTATRFDLALNIEEIQDGSIVGDLWYRTELFTRETVQDMVAQLIRIWSNLAARPELPLPALSQSFDDRALAQQHVNLDGAGARLDSCLHREFEAQVRKAPTKIAVVGQRSSLSYEALNVAANRLAQVLRQRGVGPEDIVGIGLRRDLDYVISVLAILKAGAACLPLDITVPKARNQEIIARSSARYIIVDRSFPTDLPVSFLVLGSQSVEEELQAASPENCPDAAQEIPNGNSLAYLFFTSGSTGHPKGVALTHNAYVWVFRDQNYIPFSDNTVMLQHSPVTFDAFALELWTAFFSGGTCVLSPERGLTPATLKELVQQHKLTTAFFVPSMFNAFVDEDCESLSGFREIMLGGEAPSVTHLRRLRQLRPQLTLVNGYGPTETGIYAFAHVLPDGLPVERIVPIGPALAHTSAYILSGSLDPCPKGVIGEIFIGGPRLARNYIAEPQLTAERFLPDPFAGHGARMYRTGDFAFVRPDGLVEFVGRQDRQIKLNGVRIEISEIEAILLEHESVRNAMVLLHSPSPEVKRLVAFVLSDNSGEGLREILLAHLRSRLPQYMIPSQLFVSKKWPTNAHSKVDCEALLALIASRKSIPAELEPCVTPTEQLLHEIWCQVLKLDAIGREDNFFELGGNSILAIQVINRCVAAKLSLALTDLFEFQTIASLAQASDRGGLQQGQMDFCTLQPAFVADRRQRFQLPLVTLQAKGVKRPLFLAHPSPGTPFCYLALANALHNERPVYGFQAEAFTNPGQAPQRVEDMATSYIAALKQAQPEGPYLLGGHSLGAIIAFEMARQLTERKEEVRCLLLLDSIAPVFQWKEGPRNLDEEERAVFIGTIKTLERFTGKAFGIHEALIRSLPISEGYSLLYYKLREIGFISKVSDMSYIERLINVSRLGHDAFKRYKAKPWNGNSVTLFRAAQPQTSDYPGPISSALDHPYYRWDELLAHPPDTVTVPGNHITMLTAPHVSHLASAIASRLVEADTFNISKCHSEENNMDASVMVAPDIDNHRNASATGQKIEDISITVTDVEKRYGNLKVLNGVSFSVPRGKVFGLLGPNGAGKSTLMKILSTVSTLDSGSVRIGDFSVTKDASRVRRMIGVVPQKSGADRALTAVENLWIQGIVYGLRGAALRERIDQLLRRFELSDAAHRLVRNFSGGMVRRLDLAIGLIHRPTVLLLDEPTVGLDPTARAALWQSIQELSVEGITVLLTTHHLEEADYLANNVAILHQGRIVIEGAPQDLKADLAGDALEVTLDPPSSSQYLIDSLRSMEIFREIQIEENELRVRTDSGTNSAPTFLAALAGIGVKVHSLRISGPSLEDVYKRYTGFRFPAAG